MFALLLKKLKWKDESVEGKQMVDFDEGSGI